jgi:hypothetical protein
MMETPPPKPPRGRITVRALPSDHRFDYAFELAREGYTETVYLLEDDLQTLTVLLQRAARKRN